MAPEVIENGDKGYDAFKSDVWAAACTLCEMLTGRPPWEPMANMVGVLFKIARSTGWPDAVPKSDPTFQDPALKDFLDRAFSKDPTKRPTADECLAHPYLKE
jgi:serine/threonine protein kinase